MTAAINLARLQAELHALASFSEAQSGDTSELPQPARAVTRVVFTPRDVAARAWLRERAEAAGFSVRADALGNTFVRWEGTAPELPAVATGSHIDAIPFSGMYDGTVGVLGGLEAMRALGESGFVPHRSIELVLLTSEEPTRFGIGCLGSRVMSGQLSPAAAAALPDRLGETFPEAAGIVATLDEARQAAGFHGSLAGVPLEKDHYLAWLELHIEQGPLLEREGLDLGVVTHIAGPASYRFTLDGKGGHAGALLMPDRRDALCAAAELVLAIEQAALRANDESGHPDSVATVGKLDVFPGNVNAVPSRVSLMLDMRDVDTGSRDRMMASIRQAVTAIEARRSVRVREERINEDDPARCDPFLIDLLEAEATALGARHRTMVSRAYHDTTFMARLAPVAMLFIPCRDGVSHRPDEFAHPEAIALGTRVLAATLARLSLIPGGTVWPPPAAVD